MTLAQSVLPERGKPTIKIGLCKAVFPKRMGVWVYCDEVMDSLQDGLLYLPFSPTGGVAKRFGVLLADILAYSKSNGYPLTMIGSNKN